MKMSDFLKKIKVHNNLCYIYRLYSNGFCTLFGYEKFYSKYECNKCDEEILNF